MSLSLDYDVINNKFKKEFTLGKSIIAQDFIDSYFQ